MSTREDLDALEELMREQYSAITDQELAAMKEHERLHVLNIRALLREHARAKAGDITALTDASVERVVSKVIHALENDYPKTEPRTCAECGFVATSGMGPRGDACPVLLCPGVLAEPPRA